MVLSKFINTFVLLIFVNAGLIKAAEYPLALSELEWQPPFHTCDVVSSDNEQLSRPELLDLPDELLLHIMTWLPTQEHMQLIVTCSRIYCLSYDSYGLINHLRIEMLLLDPAREKTQAVAAQFNQLWQKDPFVTTEVSDIQEIKSFISNYKHDIDILYKVVGYYSRRLKWQCPLALSGNYGSDLQGKPQKLEESFPCLQKEEINTLRKVIHLYQSYNQPRAVEIDSYVGQFLKYARSLISSFNKDKIAVIKRGTKGRERSREQSFAAVILDTVVMVVR